MRGRQKRPTQPPLNLIFWVRSLDLDQWPVLHFLAAAWPTPLQPRELERKEESQQTHMTAPTRRHDSSAFKYPHNGKFRKLGSGESHQFSKPSIICSM